MVFGIPPSYGKRHVHPSAATVCLPPFTNVANTLARRAHVQVRVVVVEARKCRVCLPVVVHGAAVEHSTTVLPRGSSPRGVDRVNVGRATQESIE